MNSNQQYIKAIQNKYWFVLDHEDKIKRGKLYSYEICSIPIVVYKSSNGEIIAQLNRCPHRHVELSNGYLKNNRLVCPYHRWEFDQKGDCKKVPGLSVNDNFENSFCMKVNLKNFQVKVIKKICYIFLDDKQDCENKNIPFVPEHTYSRELRMKTFFHSLTINCPFIDLVENFLDPFHTPILHPGLIRTDKKRTLNKIEFQQFNLGFEFIYHKPKKQSGAFSALGPNIKKGIGKFILPSTVQLEFYSDNGLEYSNTMFLSPINPTSTRALFYVSVKNNLIYPLLFQLIGKKILLKVVEQDKFILENQMKVKNYPSFDKENYFIYRPTDFSRPLLEKILLDPNSHLEFISKNVLL